MHRLDDEDFEDEIPIFSGRGEGIMEEAPATGSGAARRNEDIALDLMKFIAMTTGYGRTTSTGVGFQGTGSASKPEDYANHLLDLYGKCLGAVAPKKVRTCLLLHVPDSLRGAPLWSRRLVIQVTFCPGGETYLRK